MTTTSIGAVLKGDADGDAQAEDVQVINEVRDLLFNEVVPGVGGGQDLIALDIERGRVNGIGSYNQVRVALGLPAVTSFAQITSNVQVQQELQEAYGNVNNIDAFEGGLAEDPVPGSDVGPLFQTIMVDQFTALRDGDRFFYLNEQFRPSENSHLPAGQHAGQGHRGEYRHHQPPERRVHLPGLDQRNGVARPGLADHGSGKQGLAGITVQLEDTSGDVLATTVTNSQGQYTFNQLSGPAANPENASGVSGTGYYNVVLVLPASLQQVSPDPSPILISRGGINVNGVNFTVADPGIHFTVIAMTQPMAGTSTPVMVEALNASNQVVASYTGTIQLVGSDAIGTLPGGFTFVASDDGTKLFWLTLQTTDSPTLTPTDLSSSWILSGVID